MKKLSIVAIVLAGVALLALVGETLIFATHKETPIEVQKQAIQHGSRIYAPPIPDSVSFCGEKLPMDNYYVKEALDRELIVNMYGHTNMILWMKRANRVFPVIEPILKKNGVPADMKYLCVAESGLTTATSPAKAQGYWQFMEMTGKTYGLEINADVDMRNDLEASTEAACKFLKVLYSHLGSWSAAAAAYNCGEGGLSKRMGQQSAKSYYDTRLNSETARYVFRIVAIKLVMQHPQDYGFYLRKCDLYPVIPTTTATLEGQNVDLYEFAKKKGVSYKVLRELNPWLNAEKIVNKGNKKYTVKLPTEKGTSLSKIQKDEDRSTAIVGRF